MKLLTYKENGFERLGVVSQDGKMVYDLADIGLSFFNMNDLISRITKEDQNKIYEFMQSPENGIELRK